MTVSTIPARHLLTVQLGRHSQAGYREFVQTLGGAASDRTKELLSHPLFTRYSEVGDKRLLALCGADLGFTSRYSLDDRFFETVVACGFEECLSEVGPKLWIDYPHQPMDEALIIGMRPLVCSDGVGRAFVVQRIPKLHRLHWALECNIDPAQPIVLIERTR